MFHILNSVASGVVSGVSYLVQSTQQAVKKKCMDPLTRLFMTSREEHPIYKEIQKVTQLPNDIVNIIFYYQGTMERILADLKPDELVSRFRYSNQEELESMGGTALTKSEKNKSFRGICLDRREGGYTLCFVSGKGGYLERADIEKLMPEAMQALISRKITPISYSVSVHRRNDYGNSLASFEEWQRGCAHDRFVEQLTISVQEKRPFDNVHGEDLEGRLL